MDDQRDKLIQEMNDEVLLLRKEMAQSWGKNIPNHKPKKFAIHVFLSMPISSRKGMSSWEILNESYHGYIY